MKLVSEFSLVCHSARFLRAVTARFARYAGIGACQGRFIVNRSFWCQPAQMTLPWRKWHYRDPSPPRANGRRWVLPVTCKHSAWSSDPRMTICTLPTLLHEVSIHRHATRLHPLSCPSSPSFPVRRRCCRELDPQPATYDWRNPRTHRRCSVPQYCQQQNYHQCHGPPTSPDRATGQRCDSRKWRWKTSGGPKTWFLILSFDKVVSLSPPPPNSISSIFGFMNTRRTTWDHPSLLRPHLYYTSSSGRSITQPWHKLSDKIWLFCTVRLSQLSRAVSNCSLIGTTEISLGTTFCTEERLSIIWQLSTRRSAYL